MAKCVDCGLTAEVNHFDTCSECAEKAEAKADIYSEYVDSQLPDDPKPSYEVWLLVPHLRHRSNSSKNKDDK